MLIRINKINRNHKIALMILFIFLGAIFLLPNLSLAQEADLGIGYAESTGLGDNDPRIIIARIIRVVLGFLGVIAVGLIMYAGWLWMTSEGDEEKLTQAQAILKNAIIGMVIILSSFAIASFILNRLTAANTGGGPGGGPGGGGNGAISALGRGIIESHYPARAQKDVPRNTKIIITFKEPINPATIMAGENINSENIKIYKSSDGAENALASEQVSVKKTDDNKNFIFKPNEYLGGSSEKIWYTVALGTGITKINGDSAFSGAVGEIAYDWSFEVGNFIDITPPKVDSIVPQASSTEPRNVVIQINFSEAIDPLSGGGAVEEGFENINVSDQAGGALIEGNFYISNEYRTVEFLTEDACGINSCGNTVFCLPGGKNISVLAKAASLMVIGEPTADFPYDGLVDMADNSLDGNADGLASGPEVQSGRPPYNANSPEAESQGDDYTWQFITSNEIDTSAPVIKSVNPDINENNVSLDVAPEAIFSKLLMSASANTNSVKLISNNINYWIKKENNLETKETTVFVKHDQFYDNIDYSMEINSGLKDIYQNCYSPCSSQGCAGNPSCCE
ncbi:hypothetical protein COV49_01010, partial [Candidatus Falkowbacteria bacterium CG11_big_fil_rev_8_21_14_0_20_39_10]